MWAIIVTWQIVHSFHHLSQMFSEFLLTIFQILELTPHPPDKTAHKYAHSAGGFKGHCYPTVNHKAGPNYGRAS